MTQESGALYLDACASTPPAAEVLEAMASAQSQAWANPSSLHGFGLAAAEQLERARLGVAQHFGCTASQVLFTSGGTESIHLALLGMAASEPPARLLISAVEHPATLAAAAQLQRLGWEVDRIPVDQLGVVNMEAFERLLQPPTRLVSVIWGQSEVGTVQPIEALGERCRQAGVPLHVDAVQVVGHRAVPFNALPIDLLSLAAHKLQGPRGVGALVVRSDLRLQPLIGGGGQERGLRGGTEPVVLAAGLARALALAEARLQAHAGVDPIAPLRDALLQALLACDGLRLTGPNPLDPQAPGRLPHHISLLVGGPGAQPLSGRRLVRALWQQGVAVSSGSACSSGRAAHPDGLSPSPVLEAMGYGPGEAASGLRLSLGPWHSRSDLIQVPAAVVQARRQLLAS